MLSSPAADPDWVAPHQNTVTHVDPHAPLAGLPPGEGRHQPPRTGESLGKELLLVPAAFPLTLSMALLVFTSFLHHQLATLVRMAVIEIETGFCGNYESNTVLLTPPLREQFRFWDPS